MVLIYPLKHEKRVFVQKIGYATGIGHMLGGLKARRELGFPGRDPDKVFTNPAIIGYDEEMEQMRLRTMHLGSRYKMCGPIPAST